MATPRICVLRSTNRTFRTLASFWATRDSPEDRCLARLGLGARRVRSLLGCPPGLRVWLTTGLRPVGHRDEVWLKKGLPCS
jgi:hypothetical protein